MWRFIKKNIRNNSNNFNLSHVNSLECFSMNNQECKTRPQIIDINNNEPGLCSILTVLK